MDYQVNEKSHISLTACEDIKEICSPLFKELNLKSFQYSRIYQDGSRSELSTHREYLKESFLQKKITNKVYSPNLLPTNQRYLFITQWVESMPYEFNKKFTRRLKAQQQHKFGNGFVIVNHQENFHECFHFYSPLDNKLSFHNYCQNLHLLEHFIFYFKDKGQDIIQRSVSQKLVPPWMKDTNSPLLKIYNENEIVLNKMNVERYFIDKGDFNTHLTKREFRCASLLIKGYDFKSIANKLNISSRTVETHINNIKLKLNCHSRMQLVELLNKARIL